MRYFCTLLIALATITSRAAPWRGTALSPEARQ